MRFKAGSTSLASGIRERLRQRRPRHRLGLLDSRTSGQLDEEPATTRAQRERESSLLADRDWFVALCVCRRHAPYKLAAVCSGPVWSAPCPLASREPDPNQVGAQSRDRELNSLKGQFVAASQERDKRLKCATEAGGVQMAPHQSQTTGYF